jgi:hypothetical protein
MGILPMHSVGMNFQAHLIPLVLHRVAKKHGQDAHATQALLRISLLSLPLWRD